MSTMSAEAIREKWLKERRVQNPATARGPELERRLMMLYEGLVNGVSRPELIAQGMIEWGVSKRTMHWYLQKLARRLAKLADQESHVVVQQTSQLQRNRVLEHLFRAMGNLNLRDPRAQQILTQLAPVAAKLIDGRERSARDAEETLREGTTTVRLTAEQTFTQAVVLAAPEAAHCAVQTELQARLPEAADGPKLLPGKEESAEATPAPEVAPIAPHCAPLREAREANVRLDEPR